MVKVRVKVKGMVMVRVEFLTTKDGKNEINLLCGDNIKLLKTLAPNSVDSVVTDPPYGLKFMNKKWDHSVPSIKFWKEVLRVLKPGGHVLSFGGTRTYHRMAVAIEDAGFEIRDQIMWLYGSGFPKSHNISKAIDKKLDQPQQTTYKPNYKNNDFGKGMGGGKTDQTTKPNSDLAKQWDGFGTALKPANEPIVLARKPLSEKTIVDNVLKHGTGGLNIDASRVGTELIQGGRSGRKDKSNFNASIGDKQEKHQGRFPANIILDEEAGNMLDKQSGSGCASRFFYCAKTSKSERNAGLTDVTNNHPTVKPIKLMQYLIKLVTPPKGVVLDPFTGSGSTGVAAKVLGFGFIGMELDSYYFDIAKNRIKNTAIFMETKESDARDE